MVAGITAPGPGITSHGIMISSSFKDLVSGCTIFMGSGAKICCTIGIKDQKFGTKMGSAMRKHTSLQF